MILLLKEHVCNTKDVLYQNCRYIITKVFFGAKWVHLASENLTTLNSDVRLLPSERELEKIKNLKKKMEETEKYLEPLFFDKQRKVIKLYKEILDRGQFCGLLSLCERNSIQEENKRQMTCSMLDLEA